MRRPGSLSKLALYLQLFLLAMLLVGVGLGKAETLKVERSDMQLYQAPTFASPSLGSVPLGAEVAVVSRSGDWTQVNYQGKTGWLHKLAFPQDQSPGVLLPELRTAGPVRETKSDEVALAGKGFTPEVEASYRQKNPGLKYTQVDKIENFQVNPAQMAAFLKEGKLHAEAGSEAVTAVKGFSDSEEYYLGRAVAANILAKYPLYQHQAVTLYVNDVGQAVAQRFRRTATSRGFHFAVLDTSEPNAFACPGGIIFVTRGLIKDCQNEDELAAVLAHEVAHVVHKDGINSISKARRSEKRTTAVTKTLGKARWVSAMAPGGRRRRRRQAARVGTKALQSGGGMVAGSLVNLFEDSINDVVKTIVVSGYSRSAEESADREAVSILTRTGYNPAALTTLLTKMNSRGGGGRGISRTHPPTSDRLARVKSLVRGAPGGPGEQARTKRFQQVKL